MPLWDELAGLEARVDGYALRRRELARDGWTRVTTTVVLDGDGEAGEGEDVTYDAAEHDAFPAELMLAGTWSLDDLSRRLDDFELPDYRRWAFESAALDLALRQAGRSLADVVGRPYRPVRFVASTRSDVAPWLENDPALEFKLDATKEWDEELMRRLAALDRVRVVDLKAYYRGTVVDLEPDRLLSSGGGRISRRGDRGRMARGRLPGGVERGGGAAELRRADPLARGLRRLADRGALVEREAVTLRHGAQARRVHRGV